MLKFKYVGDYSKTTKFLDKLSKVDLSHIFDKYGEKGVIALSNATPVDTGETRNSWKFSVSKTRRGYSLSWYNTNMAGNIPLVILLQYGHGTGAGAYIPGRDFINPAIQPIMDSLSEEIWKEVTKE